MGSKKSWRLSFIDIDSSFSISTDAGTIKGYMVVRAPKGEVEPYYFPKGNMEAIYAYVGLPTAHWPDLYEAEAFNREYGLYLSAPAGSSKDYPSYFGGAYVTKNGLVDFYNVTGKDVVDFTKKVTVGIEGSSYGWKNNTTTNFIVRKTSPYDSGYAGAKPAKNGDQETCAVVISGIDPNRWGTLQEVAVNYWGDERSDKEAGTYYYWLDKANHKVYCEDEDGNPIRLDDDEKDLYCGVWGEGSNGYFVIIGGGTWLTSTDQAENGKNTITELVAGDTILAALGLDKAVSNNTVNNEGIPFFTLDGLIAGVEEAASLTKSATEGSAAEPDGVEPVVKWENIINFFNGTLASDKDIFGKSYVYENLLYKVGETAGSPKTAFTWLVNIKNETYGYFIQKSASEKTTVITISGIGYDKYKYDMALPVVYHDGGLASIKNDTTLTKALFENSIGKTLGEDGLFLFSGSKNPMADKTQEKFSIIKYDSEAANVKKALTDVTKEYTTKLILTKDTYLFAKSTNVYTCEKFNDSPAKWCVAEAGSSGVTPLKDAKLSKDINYNTITFNVKEEVYPGQMTSGGEFTGSLDENGKDSYGANIYFPNVLSSDDFSFLEFEPIKTFDEDLNSNGIYQETRIVDDILTTDMTGNPVGPSVDLKLKGQRFAQHVVDMNIADGTTGGSWRDEFFTIIKQGWNEAFQDEYDDAYVFMDPTGQEYCHEVHNSLAQTHQLAVYISPKLLTKGEVANPSKITVIGRNKLCAQYAGEFKCYDPYTGKYFYTTPIGDVGYMLCRIIENKMGGWAPAWYNYNNMGGQLGRAVISAKYQFDDAATQIMDQKGINPIVFNADDGLMCVSGKTTQDPNNVTDWSFLGHVMAFNLCKREIRDNVMRQQIEKPIDDYWMGVRQTQVEAILAKRTQGSNKIWAAATCDIAGVNTDITRAMRKFCIYVKVKVNPFSEKVELTFENVSQTTVLN